MGNERGKAAITVGIALMVLGVVMVLMTLSAPGAMAGLGVVLGIAGFIAMCVGVTQRKTRRA